MIIHLVGWEGLCTSGGLSGRLLTIGVAFANHRQSLIHLSDGRAVEEMRALWELNGLSGLHDIAATHRPQRFGLAH